jgi:hypothetical protein
VRFKRDSERCKQTREEACLFAPVFAHVAMENLQTSAHPSEYFYGNDAILEEN